MNNESIFGLYRFGFRISSIIGVHSWPIVNDELTIGQRPHLDRTIVLSSLDWQLLRAPRHCQEDQGRKAGTHYYAFDFLLLVSHSYRNSGRDRAHWTAQPWSEPVPDIGARTYGHDHEHGFVQ